MNTRLTQEQIIQYIKDGWELGSNNGYWWLQKPSLCCGGETHNVHSLSAYALLRKQKIKSVNKKGDPFWLTRWVLVR